MVVHEVFGLLTMGIVALVFVSALSNKATTNSLLKTSFDGYASVLDSISAPLRG